LAIHTPLANFHRVTVGGALAANDCAINTLLRNPFAVKTAPARAEKQIAEE